MITLPDYWMGRDKAYAHELTADIQHSAEITIARANILLTQFRVATSDTGQRTITSGWRPAEINAATPNASSTSKHMTGQAIDIADPHGDLDDWCLANQDALARINLWLEHPASTKGWCHVQTVAPKSGRRVFYP